MAKSNYRIYHNPRCSKSRQALDLLRNNGIEPEVIEYLKTPLSEEELSSLIQKLGIEPSELIRKSEQIFKVEYNGKDLSSAEWLQAMIKHPKLMERPIIENKSSAIIGRPPELALSI